MKLNLLLALAAALVCAPMTSVFAADAKDKEEAAEKAGPTDAEKAKAAKLLKQTGGKYVVKFSKVKHIAEMGGYPVLVAMLPEGNQVGAFIKQKILTRKEFKELAMNNFVTVVVQMKLSKDGKSIDTRSMRDADAIKVMENFGVTESAKQQAASAGKPEPKPTDARLYPAILLLDSLCQKEIDRVPLDNASLKDDPKAVFGIWLTQLVDRLAKTGIEVKHTPLVDKILENPTGEKK